VDITAAPEDLLEEIDYLFFFFAAGFFAAFFAVFFLAFIMVGPSVVNPSLSRIGFDSVGTRTNLVRIKRIDKRKFPVTAIGNFDR